MWIVLFFLYLLDKINISFKCFHQYQLKVLLISWMKDLWFFFFNFLFQYKDPTFSKKRIHKSFEARFCYLNLNFLAFLFVWSEMSSDGFGGYKE